MNSPLLAIKFGLTDALWARESLVVGSMWRNGWSSEFFRMSIETLLGHEHTNTILANVCFYLKTGVHRDEGHRSGDTQENNFFRTACVRS